MKHLIQKRTLRPLWYQVIIILQFFMRVDGAEDYRTFDIVDGGSGHTSKQILVPSGFSLPQAQYASRMGALDIQSRYWGKIHRDEFPEESEDFYSTLPADQAEQYTGQQEQVNPTEPQVTIDRADSAHTVTINMPRMERHGGNNHVIKKFVIQPVIQYVVQYDKNSRQDFDDGSGAQLEEYEGVQEENQSQDGRIRRGNENVERLFDNVNAQFETYWGNDENNANGGNYGGDPNFDYGPDSQNNDLYGSNYNGDQQGQGPSLGGFVSLEYPSSQSVSPSSSSNGNNNGGDGNGMSLSNAVQMSNAQQQPGMQNSNSQNSANNGGGQMQMQMGMGMGMPNSAGSSASAPSMGGGAMPPMNGMHSSGPSNMNSGGMMMQQGPQSMGMGNMGMQQPPPQMSMNSPPQSPPRQAYGPPGMMPGPPLGSTSPPQMMMQMPPMTMMPSPPPMPMQMPQPMMSMPSPVPPAPMMANQMAAMMMAMQRPPPPPPPQFTPMMTSPVPSPVVMTSTTTQAVTTTQTQEPSTSSSPTTSSYAPPPSEPSPSYGPPSELVDHKGKKPCRHKGRRGKSIFSSLANLPKLPASIGGHLHFMFTSGFGKGRKGRGGKPGEEAKPTNRSSVIDKEQVSDHILNILGLTVHHPPGHSLNNNASLRTINPILMWEQHGNQTSLNHLSHPPPTTRLPGSTPPDVSTSPVDAANDDDRNSSSLVTSTSSTTTLTSIVQQATESTTSSDFSTTTEPLTTTTTTTVNNVTLNDSIEEDQVGLSSYLIPNTTSFYFPPTTTSSPVSTFYFPTTTSSPPSSTFYFPTSTPSPPITSFNFPMHSTLPPPAPTTSITLKKPIQFLSNLPIIRAITLPVLPTTSPQMYVFPVSNSPPPPTTSPAPQTYIFPANNSPPLPTVAPQTYIFPVNNSPPSPTASTKTYIFPVHNSSPTTSPRTYVFPMDNSLPSTTPSSSLASSLFLFPTPYDPVQADINDNLSNNLIPLEENFKPANNLDQRPTIQAFYSEQNFSGPVKVKFDPLIYDALQAAFQPYNRIFGGVKRKRSRFYPSFIDIRSRSNLTTYGNSTSEMGTKDEVSLKI